MVKLSGVDSPLTFRDSEQFAPRLKGKHEFFSENSLRVKVK